MIEKETGSRVGWLSGGMLAAALTFSGSAFANQADEQTDTTERQNQQSAQQQAQQQGQRAQQQAAQQQGADVQQQTAQTGQQRQAGAGAAAEQPSTDVLRQGWSADRLLGDAEIISPQGDTIGSAENLLINEQGRIVAVVAQVGGFWDIGDTHIAIPWDQVERRGDDLHVPVTQDNVGEYSLFKEEYFTQADVGDLQTVEDDLETGADIWKATDLLNDYAVLEDGEGYGYVDDLTFDQQGQLQAVIVDATADYVTPGYYAYPWYGYGYSGYAWDPGLGYYTLPYGPTGVTEFAAFEYNDLYY